MTGNPCSYSPREAAWNHKVLSLGFIALASILKTSFLPLTNNFILGLKSANTFTICEAKRSNTLYKKSIPKKLLG
jgi:hypothetical protein